MPNSEPTPELNDNSPTSLERIYGKPGIPGASPPYDLPKVIPPIPETARNVARQPEQIMEHTVPEKEKEVKLLETNKEKETKPIRRVTLFRDHCLEYPDLWLNIFVSPDPDVPEEEARFARMFSRSGCSRAKSVLEADLVVFGGGSDVDPELYGEERHETTFFDSDRDLRDIDLYLLCLEHGIPMLGICRGAQFLHVMNGGKLYQHVDNHYGPHTMLDLQKRELIQGVSSVHHQMVIANKEGGMDVIGTTNKARNRWRNPKVNDNGSQADVEAFFYRKTCSIGIQGHPEYAGNNKFQTWTLSLLNDLIVVNLDIIWEGSVRRLSPEFLKERKENEGASLIPKTVQKYIDKHSKKETK